MNRYEIIKYYENKIDDVVDETKKEELQKQLTQIEEDLISLEGEIDEEVEQQESDYLPSPNEMWQEFEVEREGLML